MIEFSPKMCVLCGNWDKCNLKKAISFFKIPYQFLQTLQKYFEFTELAEYCKKYKEVKI